MTTWDVPLAGLGGLGGMEMLFLLGILLLLFGARRIGDIGKGLGEGIRNFRQAMKDGAADAPPANPPRDGGDAANPASPANKS